MYIYIYIYTLLLCPGYARIKITPTCFLVTWLVGLLLGWLLNPGTVAGWAKQLDIIREAPWRSGAVRSYDIYIYI